MGKKIMVVAAHPDDEVLGCGGATARHILDGDEVHTLILAEGLTSRKSHSENYIDNFKDLYKAARKANNILGVSSITLNNYPDNRMDSVDLLDIVKHVEGYIEKIKPEIIYTHHGGDLNIDHRLTHEAVKTA